MHKGEVFKKGTPEEIFSSPEGLIELGLDVPEVVRFQQKVEQAFQIKFPQTCLSVEKLTEEIAVVMKRGELK
jgi:energy-coupling factor transport system ATP-binding protein